MKTVLITGASSGIGEAAARRLAKEGYRLILNYHRSEDSAKQLEKEIRTMGVDAVAMRCDISDYSAVQSMVKEVIDRFRFVDILINNAGIGEYKLFQDITPDDWRKIFAVNVDGVYNVTHAVLPHMLSRHEGKILNVSSIWGIVGGAMEVHYSATKGAINAFTKALAQEVGYSGITVNALAPGAVETKMVQSLGRETIQQLCEDIPMGRLATCEEIAEMIAFLVSDKNSYMNGQIISPNGGMVVY